MGVVKDSAPAGQYAQPQEVARVLQIEDAEADAELLLDALRNDGIECVTRLVDNEQAFVDALETFAPDIILSDLSLPGFNGYRALELLRERDPVLPFIFVSGTMGEEVAVEALRKGATDYVLKDNPVRLAPAVRRALRDAAEQRNFGRLEAELMRAQRFESLALLAGGLSHDLRNLLQPLLLAADALDEYKDDPRLGRLGGLVRSCGQRGLEMVSSMLAFARGARQAEQVRLGGLFQAVALLLQGSVPRSVKLEISESDDPELQFEGNQTELQQCLLNLCLNAIQAMPDGGTVRVGARRLKLDETFFSAGEKAVPGDFLELTVSDSGTGMSPETMAKLFQPFFSTKPGGTGLGLMSCKRIVESYGGVMRVRSVVGEGSTFALYLPLQPAEEGEAGRSTSLPAGQGERVLIVAENAGKLALLADSLGSYGYDVRSEQSGAAALLSLERDGLPQLVIVDADMSLLTGVRTLAALVERDYRGAVLMLARPEAPPDLEGLPDSLDLHLLDKPVQVDALLYTVRDALDSARRRAQQ
ncbi:MAG TPA: response regulator [Rhodanobacteraceae bacterium]|nr:response regulator [Rhodanobacteraceae bacterium]